MTEINKVINGDCIEGMQRMSDNSVDLIIADPPYGIDFNSNYRKQELDEEYVAIANQRIQDAIQAKEGGVH